MQSGEDITIDLPEYNPNLIKAPFAYTIKIAGFGAFAKKPEVRADYKGNSLVPTVTISGPGPIYYTTDGKEPTLQSSIYKAPFQLQQTATIKAKAFPAAGLPSSIATEKLSRYSWMKAVAPGPLQPGVAYKYYEPTDEDVSLASMKTAPVAKTGVSGIFTNEVKQRPEKFVIAFDGYIRIAKEGYYTFFTNSDDGSKLFIDGVEIVDNDGDHGNTEKQGRAALRKGFHKIAVQFFDGAGNNSLNVLMQPDGGEKLAIPASILFH